MQVALGHSWRHSPDSLSFITSRPEAHVFNHDPDLQAITVNQYNLSHDPDSDMDIRKFLEKGFIEIHRVHCLWQSPRDWTVQKTTPSLLWSNDLQGNSCMYRL